MNDQRTTMNGKPVYEVPAKTVINFDSRFDKKLLCDGITFTAGNGCVYKCAFCYVPDMQTKAMAWHEKNGVVYPADGHLGVVIRIKNAVALARQQIASKPESFRMAKKVIYSSPKVDVAGNMDLVRETVEICKVILELTNWDIRLLSKSNLLPKVATLLQEWKEGPCGPTTFTRIDPKTRIIYGVSTGTLDDRVAAAFEEGTPKVSKRIESLHWLQDNGFRTFGMLCPSLPQTTYAGYLGTAGKMFDAIRADKCEEVWAEVINVRGDSFERTKAKLIEHGFISAAFNIQVVTHSKERWEEYARNTFNAHRVQPYRKGQLRFLQYVTPETKAWWQEQTENGAVLL